MHLRRVSPLLTLDCGTSQHGTACHCMSLHVPVHSTPWEFYNPSVVQICCTASEGGKAPTAAPPHLLFFALLCHDHTRIHHQAVWRQLQQQQYIRKVHGQLTSTDTNCRGTIKTLASCTLTQSNIPTCLLAFLTPACLLACLLLPMPAAATELLQHGWLLLLPQSCCNRGCCCCCRHRTAATRAPYAAATALDATCKPCQTVARADSCLLISMCWLTAAGCNIASRPRSALYSQACETTSPSFYPN